MYIDIFDCVSEEERKNRMKSREKDERKKQKTNFEKDEKSERLQWFLSKSIFFFISIFYTFICSPSFASAFSFLKIYTRLWMNEIMKNFPITKFENFTKHSNVMQLTSSWFAEATSCNIIIINAIGTDSHIFNSVARRMSRISYNMWRFVVALLLQLK